MEEHGLKLNLNIPANPGSQTKTISKLQITGWYAYRVPPSNRVAMATPRTHWEGSEGEQAGESAQEFLIETIAAALHVSKRWMHCAFLCSCISSPKVCLRQSCFQSYVHMLNYIKSKSCCGFWKMCWGSIWWPMIFSGIWRGMRISAITQALKSCRGAGDGCVRQKGCMGQLSVRQVQPRNHGIGCLWDDCVPFMLLFKYQI